MAAEGIAVPEEEGGVRFRDALSPCPVCEGPGLSTEGLEVCALKSVPGRCHPADTDGPTLCTPRSARVTVSPAHRRSLCRLSRPWPPRSRTLRAAASWSCSEVAERSGVNVQCNNFLCALGTDSLCLEPRGLGFLALSLPFNTMNFTLEVSNRHAHGGEGV